MSSVRQKIFLKNQLNNLFKSTQLPLSIVNLMPSSFRETEMQSTKTTLVNDFRMV